MPTNDELRALKATPAKRYDTTSATDVETFKIAHLKANFFFAKDAREAGARTNLVDGMWIGKDEAGNEIWASLVSGHHQYACEALHRAFIHFQLLENKSGVAGVRAIVLTGLLSLDTVAEWHGSIKGGGISERYNFIYDALVEEAKSSTHY
jgi:hypothetical protein